MRIDDNSAAQEGVGHPRLLTQFCFLKQSRVKIAALGAGFAVAALRHAVFGYSSISRQIIIAIQIKGIEAMVAARGKCGNVPAKNKSYCCFRFP
jgi:hypothetical protein